VLLDGQGSDEVLFGYPMQMGALIVNCAQRGEARWRRWATFFHLGRRDPHRSARFRLLSSAAVPRTAVALPALCPELLRAP